MTASPNIDDDTKGAIRDTTRSQPLGDTQDVQCADCGDHLKDSDQVKAFLTGNTTPVLGLQRLWPSVRYVVSERRRPAAVPIKKSDLPYFRKLLSHPVTFSLAKAEKDL